LIIDYFIREISETCATCAIGIGIRG